MKLKMLLPSLPLLGVSLAAAGGDGALPIPENCVRFEACVDGSDFVSIEGGKLKVTHHSWNLMGENPSCNGLKSFTNFSTSLFNAARGAFSVSGRHVGDATGEVTVPVHIEKLNTYHFIYGRGTVIYDPRRSHQIYISDMSADGTMGYGGAGHYIVDLCQ